MMRRYIIYQYQRIKIAKLVVRANKLTTLSLSLYCAGRSSTRLSTMMTIEMSTASAVEKRLLT